MRKFREHLRGEAEALQDCGELRQRFRAGQCMDGDRLFQRHH